MITAPPLAAFAIPYREDRFNAYVIFTTVLYVVDPDGEVRCACSYRLCLN